MSVSEDWMLMHNLGKFTFNGKEGGKEGGREGGREGLSQRVKLFTRNRTR